MNFWFYSPWFDKRRDVVPGCLQKLAEMPPQPQGRTTTAQMKKMMMMTYFLYVEPPPVRVTRGIKHWCRQSEEGRRAFTKPRRFRDPARSSAFVPTNFRARSQALGSPLKTRIWQRCRCWTLPCWTTRARSETRFSSRSPSSAWKICRRVSELLHVRYLHGFSGQYLAARMRCVPLPALGSTRGGRIGCRLWPEHIVIRKVVEKIWRWRVCACGPARHRASIGWVTFVGCLSSTLVGQSRPPSNSEEELVKYF